MAQAAIGRVALFSIHPRFAEAIMDGSKKVEFRRTVLPADVTHIVMYATSPVQRVVGSFEVAGVVAVRPSAAWRRYRDVGGIDRATYDRYFADAATAYVIQVRNAQQLSSPRSLRDIDPALRPPQSFQYLSPNILVRNEYLLAAHCEESWLRLPISMSRSVVVAAARSLVTGSLLRVARQHLDGRP